MRKYLLTARIVAVIAPVVAVDAQAPAAKPETTADSGFFHRGQLTGDWNGLRTTWKNKGFELPISLTQFEQGVASGGINTGSEYNGTAQAKFKFEFEKLTGWKNWFAEARAETRFGGPLLGGVGSISPVNTAVIIPAAAGTVFSVTALNVTKLIPIYPKKGEFLAVSVGRYNLVDVINEELFAGAGIERFFNIAQVGPLTVLREVPLVTNALNLAYIHGSDEIVTFSLMDPNDHSLDPGLSNLFADGVTLAPAIHFPVKYFGKTAKHSVGGAITTKPYTPFDAIRQAIIPGPPIHPVTPECGSWSVYYTFRQYIVERSRGDGWGFFSQVSAANESTSPVTRFFDLGLGGNGLFTKRQSDEFGVAYAYTDLSKVLEDNLDLLPVGGRLRAEYQLEAFYNLHIAPWLQLTGDLQVIRPNRPAAKTATIPGARLRVVF